MAHQEKIGQLTQQASTDIASGNLSHAAELLREASAIQPDSPHIKELWQTLQLAESRGPIVRLCKSYVDSRSEPDGNEAVRYIQNTQIGRDVAAEVVQILMDFTGEDAIADKITGALFKAQPTARSCLASHLKDQPHSTFERLFERGDESIDGLFAVLLDPSAWVLGEEKRIAALRDIFMLSLAQMMEAGLEHPERVMKAIARALVAEASHLNGIIDADGFDVILASLDIRQPVSLRSQATLATAKLLELSPDNSTKLITRFVTQSVAQPTTDGLITAFSAAAAIFPIATASAAHLFLTEGFLENFGHLVASRGSQRLEQAALELVSAACIDKNCRDAINKNCRDWLLGISRSSADKNKANKAALILVKLHQVNLEEESAMTSESDDNEQDDLVHRFKRVILDSAVIAKQESMEGLAYSSLQPKVKEELANDKQFLRELINVLSNPSVPKPLMFGGLTIISNLTTYRPTRTEEQKKMQQLKAYANTKKPVPEDPLDDDKYVTARCGKLIDAGVVPLLVVECKRASPSVLAQILQTFLSLSREQKHRGTMAQQGAIKTLLQASEIATSHHQHTQTSYGQASARTAAHALARILISVNPNHIFSASSALPITSAIRSLITLLEDDPTQEQRDLLPIFESLLALTNLASTGEDAANTIIRLTWSRLEDLMLANNTMVQRAAVELVCNLMASPQGVFKFADGSPQASNRLHVLLALSDVDDFATRCAAGGALAMLTEWDAAVEAVLKRDRGVEILFGLCEDDSQDLQHRGVVCIKNIVSAPGEAGANGREKVKALNGVEKLKDVLKKSRNPEVLSEGVAALKALV
ncbi:uncharacterized protein K452DRAFT_283889 [Aplosporella prunicola CBS 121167]|uniref:UNC-45/Cro1/She4 central domain-containing protein n=1 Tax=Aplosporella prunicola CBS 121167 TaxID=1176127 RepID=A0A6A6BN52_9PEZI|nr:uncharacterized protein K452DRAFT_283889 [Aplosporella prunicola CBS 121167]KAF2145532.1 hypothetical protein K452DRAFT_283889 [Aplosporella prunicola CBS 121167]